MGYVAEIPTMYLDRRFLPKFNVVVLVQLYYVVNLYCTT